MMLWFPKFAYLLTKLYPLATTWLFLVNTEYCSWRGCAASYDNFIFMKGERIYYCKNTKGNIVPIRETEWGDANDVPTHMIIFISSSCGGAYVGTVGNSLWVDNISLVYTE